MKDTKDSELLHFSSLNFVFFATFVVNVLFPFWLRLCRARFSAVNHPDDMKTAIDVLVVCDLCG